MNLEKQTPLPRYVSFALLAILLLAVFLRLYALGSSPPGLNQDEAVNAWNAYCLLKTGTDQHGVAWPIFFMRALGANSSTLYIYAIIPFQAIGGLNVYTARLPGVLANVLTVLLIFFTARRLFNWQTGLVAAMLLAIDPWNIQQSRWGHEATIAALAGLLPLAMLLWAGLPTKNDSSQVLSPGRAALAGLLAGVVCYGYHSIRIFVPFLLFAIVAVTLPIWWDQLKSRKGIYGVAAYLAGFLATFGPLAWQHIFHLAGIARHAFPNIPWSATDSLASKALFVLNRYFGHFGLDFLFVHGEAAGNIAATPPGMGMLYWYMFPLLVIGLVVVIYKFRSSYPARLAFAFVLTYPVGDCFFKYPCMHALRSFPGSCALILLAAIGAFFAGKWLLSKSRILVWSATICLSLAMVWANARYLPRFFGEFNRNPRIYHGAMVDFIEALNWLKPQMKDIDLVFCTTQYLNMPYVISLVALSYDPHKWFAEPRKYYELSEFDICTRYGRMYFMYDSSALTAMQAAPSGTQIFIICRPNEVPLKPVYRVHGPDGAEVMWVCSGKRSELALKDSP